MAKRKVLVAGALGVVGRAVVERLAARRDEWEVGALSRRGPDFDTPAWISEAAIAGIRGGKTRYTPASGLPELRKAVARSLVARSVPGWQLGAENVVVSAGAKQALFNACFSVFGPGDEVLVGVPYWTSYPEMVSLARAEPVFVSGSEARGFRLTPGELDRVRTGRRGSGGFLGCNRLLLEPANGIAGLAERNK